MITNDKQPCNNNYQMLQNVKKQASEFKEILILAVHFFCCRQLIKNNDKLILQAILVMHTFILKLTV